MKMRRVIVTIEVETDGPMSLLKQATLRLPNIEVGRFTIRYLEQAKVNTIRPSAKARGKKKETAK